MYFNIHSGSSAPAEHDLPSLATIFHKLSSPVRRFIIVCGDILERNRSRFVLKQHQMGTVDAERSSL